MNIDRYTFPLTAIAVIAGLVVSFFNTGSTNTSNETAPAPAITAPAE